MSKSKYPNKIDSSIELPIVRDNIIQIGSEAINSLRSAIIQIEKTLGILPNGDETLTLSDRLSRSLDDLGNIKKDAIAALNLLSGPIKNKDVAERAEIEESKLNLDYSTKNLYGQLSNLKNIINLFKKEIEDISLILAIHISKDKVGAHRALNINVEDISNIPSDDSNVILTLQNLQEFLQSLISNHILFSGVNISSENNSHNASQIYYNSENGPLLSSDVQGAIDELSGTENTVLKDLRDTYFNNSYLSKNTFQINSSFGRLIQSGLSLEYFKYDESDDTLFTEIIYSGTLIEIPSKFDIITIGTNAYRIFDVDTLNLRITIYGLFFNNSLTSVTGNLYKNNYHDSSPAGLKIVPVYDGTISFSKIAKIISPNSTYIISDIIYPGKIDSANNKFTANIDGLISFEFNVLDPAETNIDSIVNSINSQASYNNFPLSCFKINTEHGSRIGIACDFENSSSKIYYINLSSTSNCLDHIGFSSYKDMNVYGDYGSKYIINGNQYSDFQNILSSSELSLSNGANTIVSDGTDINFIELGIKKNDILTIYDRGADSGVYIIKTVSQDTLGLELRSGKVFSGSNGNSFNIVIQKNSIGFDSISGTTLSSSSNLTFFLELFLDSNKNLFYNKYIEYENLISGTSPLFDIISAEKNIEKQNINFSINLFNASTPSDGLLVRFGDNEYHINKDIGEHKFEVKTPDGKGVSIFIYSLNGLISSISSSAYNSTFVVNERLNNDIYLNIGTVKYDKFRGLLSGSKANFSQIEFIPSGFINKNQISDDFINQYIDLKFDDLRSNGVISGLEITSQSVDSSGFYKFTVNSGILYVKGRRYIVKKQEIFTQILASSIDKIFIAIDDRGNVVFDQALSTTCSCPFDNEFYCVIGTIEYDGINSFYIDLRLFISDLDFKILNDISVSPTPNMGHFDDINKALSYAKRFSELFPGVGTPTVHLKSGRYIIKINHTGASSTRFTSSSYDEVIVQGGLWLDFPVIIKGEGDTSIIDVTEEWSDTVGSDRYTEFENRGGIYISGSGTSTLPSIANYTKITSGKIILKDLAINKSRIYLIDPKIDNSGSSFEVSYEFINITFDGNPDSGTPNQFDRQMLSSRDIDLSSVDKGNILVDKCSFLKGGLFLEGNTSNLKNIIISNNSWTNNGDPNDVLINQNDSSLTVILNTSNSNANIYVFSNICKSSYSNQFINCNYANINSASFNARVRLANYFSGDIRLSEDLYVKDLINGSRINLHDTSATSFIKNDAIYLGRSSSSIGVVVQSDFEAEKALEVDGVSTFNSTVDINASADISENLNVTGTIEATNINVTDLNVSGDYSGSIYCGYTARIRVSDINRFAFFRFRSHYDDHATSYGSSTFSDAAISITDKAMLPCVSDGEICKITIKNFSTGTRSGILKAYKVAQLDEIRQETLYVELLSQNIHILENDSDSFSFTGASFSQNDTLLFLMENTTSSFALTLEAVISILIKYDI